MVLPNEVHGSGENRNDQKLQMGTIPTQQTGLDAYVLGPIETGKSSWVEWGLSPDQPLFRNKPDAAPASHG